MHLVDMFVLTYQLHIPAACVGPILTAVLNSHRLGPGHQTPTKQLSGGATHLVQNHFTQLAVRDQQLLYDRKMIMPLLYHHIHINTMVPAGHNCTGLFRSATFLLNFKSSFRKHSRIGSKSYKPDMPQPPLIKSLGNAGDWASKPGQCVAIIIATKWPPAE